MSAKPRPGRPMRVITNPKPGAAAMCEKCRFLDTSRRKATCGKAHAEMNASACDDYTDTSRDRSQMLGGITGRAYP